MRSLLIALGIGSLILGAEPADGQRADELQRGAKVRVTLSDGSRTLGSLDRVSADTITLRPLDKSAGAGGAQIQRDRVTSIEVSRKAPGKASCTAACLDC